MPLIEAFLALALSMLALSMAVTLIVDFIHRLRATRASNLKEMLEEYYDSELRGFVETELRDTAANVDEHKAEFVTQLLTNPLSGKSPFLRDTLKKLVNLPTEEFVKKLAYSDVGIAIKKKSEGEINEMVDSVVLMFEHYGSGASEAFKRRAQVLSFIAGIVVAFVLNVNAVLMLKGYMDDPIVRDRVLAQAQELEERFQQMPKGGVDNGFENLDQAKALQGDIKDNIATLEGAGLAFGYGKSVAPVSFWKSAEETIESGAKGKVADGTGNGKGGTNPETVSNNWKASVWNLARTIFWLLGVFGTGLLMGLGGPFWFSVVKKITGFLEIVRGGAGGVPPAAVPGDAVASMAASTAVGSAVALNPMASYRHLFKATGGVPDSVRARVNMTVAKAANGAVAEAADAVKKAKEVARDDPGKSAAVEVAEQSYSMALKMVETLSKPEPAKDE